MAEFVNDTFTDTDNTDLTSHTRDDAGSWTTLLQDTLTLKIYSNRVVPSGGAVGKYHFVVPSGTPATAEYDVEATLYYSAGFDSAFDMRGMFVDHGGGSYDSYFVLYTVGGGQWLLRKQVASVEATLGIPFSQSLVDTTSYTVKLELRNGSQKVFIDGVERISANDADLSAKGTPLLSLQNEGSTTQGILIDSFTATDAAGGGGRASKNTRSSGFGMELGMGLWMPNEI